MTARIKKIPQSINGVAIPTLLREFRNGLGLAQEEMAKKYGTSCRTYKRWESITNYKGAPNLNDHHELLWEFFHWLSDK